MTRWQHFTLAEFNCQGTACCGHSNRMSHAFIDRLDELRHRVGFPLTVSSGYRCAQHNALVSSTGPAGPHTTGLAVDLLVDRGQAFEVAKEAFDMGFTGIGWKQHGGGRFVHLDDLQEPQHSPRPTIWTYR